MANANARANADPDPDGEPPPALRPFIEALADLLISDLTKSGGA
jgi:hypothetical protein